MPIGWRKSHWGEKIAIIIIILTNSNNNHQWTGKQLISFAHLGKMEPSWEDSGKQRAQRWDHFWRNKRHKLETKTVAYMSVYCLFVSIAAEFSLFRAADPPHFQARFVFLQTKCFRNSNWGDNCYSLIQLVFSVLNLVTLNLPGCQLNVVLFTFKLSEIDS